MIVISDCLTNTMDEGSIKVASSLAKRLKQAGNTLLISYGKSDYADVNLEINKIFTSKALYEAIKGGDGPILFVPFSSNSLGGIIKTFFLAKKSKREVYSLFALRHPMSLFARLVLKITGAKIIVLSTESYDFYSKYYKDHVIYLKTGIDTKKFSPVSKNEKSDIRKKYGYEDNDKIVLHVGHLKRGRNVDKLMSIPDDYKVIIVVSSVTEKDAELEKELKSRPNISIIDSYVPNIEDIYRMSDVYVFPVEEESNCIDVPLSVLEASACDVPVISTRYGELKNFEGQEGFCFIDSMNAVLLEESLAKMVGKQFDHHSVVEAYDWSNAVDFLKKL